MSSRSTDPRLRLRKPSAAGKGKRNEDEVSNDIEERPPSPPKRKRSEDEESDDIEERAASPPKRIKQEEDDEPKVIKEGTSALHRVIKEGTSSLHREHQQDDEDEESDELESNDSDEPILINKSQHWYEDGNLIIEVEGTEFRVHKSLLSRHSAVLKEKILRESGRTGKICESLELTDVRAAEVEYLMDFFYGNDNFGISQMRQPLDLDLCATLIRLGRKYDIKSLRDEGEERFRTSFPSDLRVWNELRNRRQPWDGIKPESDDVDFYERALGFAEEFSLQRRIPAICLSLIMMKDATELLESLGKEWPTKTHEYLTLCVGARDQILCRIHDQLNEWLDPSTRPDEAEPPSPVPGNGCTSPEKCLSNRSESILSLVCADKSNWLKHIKVMKHDLPELKQREDLICQKCRSSIQAAVGVLRSDIWEDLPSYFGLGAVWGDVV